MAFAYNQELIAFSKAIDSPRELIHRWNAKVENLMDGLIRNASNRGYLIDRQTICGSIQKQTNIMEPDYDIIVFLDNELPPDFHRVIKDFENYLSRQECVTHLYKTRFSIRLILENELHVDILPAINGVDRRRHPDLDLKDEAYVQRSEVWKMMETVLWNELPFYSSSLSEAQAEFMRIQSDFVFTVVKLMKFWIKTCLAGNGNTELNIPGLKFLTELVAVYWAQREEEKRNFSEMGALLKIFQDLSYLKKLRIMFKGYRRVSQTKIRNMMSDYPYFEQFYNVSRVIIDRGSFVIDPANPYNDVLDSVLKNRNSRNHPEILQRFEKYSRECYNVVNNVLYSRRTLPSLVPRLFQNRAFSDLRLKDKYGFLLSVTVHDDLDSFMDQKSSLQYGEKTRDVDMNALDSAFRVAVELEKFQHKLRNGSSQEITTTAKIILNEVEAHMGVNEDLTLITRSNEIRFIRSEELLSYSRMWGGASKINFLQAPIFSGRNIRDWESTETTALYCITMTLVNYTKFSE